jgi:predicted transcriptional regulator
MADLNPLERLDELLISLEAPTASGRAKAKTGATTKATPSELLGSLPRAPACSAVLTQREKILKGLANDESRHQTVLGPVLQLVRLGASGHAGVAGVLEDVKTTFVELVHKDRVGGQAEAEAEFTRAVKGALGIVLQGKTVDLYGLCRCRLDALDQLLMDRSLFTKTGLTSEKKLMRYLLSRADQHHSRLVQESQRQMSVETDISLRTVNKVLQRLVKQGWIIRVRRGSSSASGSYLISEPSALMKLTTSLPSLTAEKLVVSNVSGQVHRLFGPQGVRGGAMETFAQLSEWRVPAGKRVLVRLTPGSVKSLGLGMHSGRGRRVPAPTRRGGLTVQELHQVTGTPEQTLRRQLSRLHKDGLVFKDSERRWWRYRFDADWLADTLSISETAEIKAEKYVTDRRRFWDGRAGLEPDDARAVVKIEDAGVITYVHPKTGEVKWTDRNPPTSQ